MKNLRIKIIVIFIFIFNLTILSQVQLNYKLIVGYENDYFENPYERNLNIYYGGFGYTNKISTIFLKLNFGNTKTQLFNYIQSPLKLQYELDFYRILSKQNNIWLNYAFSSDNIFPEHRLFFNFWQKLPNKFLISTGITYYKFTDNIFLTNVGIEKYWGDYWFEFKTILHHKKPDITFSYFFSSRWFFNEENYLQLTFGTGSAQDEPFIFLSNSDRKNAYTSKIIYVNDILYGLKLRTGFTYTYEEYTTNMWRSRFSFGVGLIYSF